MENIVEVRDVSMKFNLNTEKVDSLKEYFVKFMKRDLAREEFWALNNISFNIQKGEVFGIVGFNGSGKSTLLKIIAGVLKPTKGVVKVNGSIAPLIELGAGFDMDLTAAENIFLNGAVLGHSKSFMKGKFEEIIDFSELHDFVNVPLKNYSSGMVARLGFSIATLVTPDILIVDEILGVGDYKFQEKCELKMKAMLERGTTVLLVSHTISQIKEMCDRVIWINKGNMIEVGETGEICDRYLGKL
ncbi:ABC transporter ATP-binding protein [Paenibacillus frigoriresistens]|uniref:ABC transporter ATP-binding protein n=1 Tax=Paenibacillus alginolyticus TaxID=59839 RepID=UPI0015642370|nr:ABC transporter ATP-binding protein [Paenibacillus frigoriresistens]NRF95751.1 ABC transporter ATP-binding protein [Paenibacillus frigoriresistens]